MNAFASIHPDDLLLFQEIEAKMRRVAKNYELPLRSVRPADDPRYVDHGPTSGALGYCSITGDIQLVMRGKLENGDWDDAPRREEDVLRTAAHELAHLKHFNHGPAFQEFELEMQQAMLNQGEDHREKLVRKLVKMQALRQSEAELGNTEAAENFARIINKMLIENELNPSDLDYARAADNDPVIELTVDLTKYRIARVNQRVAWQESLARTVARAHLCTFLVCRGTNRITFVGTKSHATVAEYVYGMLVPAASQMSIDERLKYANECRRNGGKGSEARGFREAWLDAFIRRINERFEDARRQAMEEAKAREAHLTVPGGTSTALMRLDGAMVKVAAYMDNRFGKKRRYASVVGGHTRSHAEGSARGKAAADRMAIGRRGISGSTGTRGRIGN